MPLGPSARQATINNALFPLPVPASPLPGPDRVTPVCSSPGPHPQCDASSCSHCHSFQPTDIGEQYLDLSCVCGSLARGLSQCPAPLSSVDTCIEMLQFHALRKRSPAAAPQDRNSKRNLRINLLASARPIAMTAIDSWSREMEGEAEMFPGKKSMLRAPWPPVTSLATIPPELSERKI